MFAYNLHNLNTIRGASGNNTTQAEDDWLDLSNHQDIIFHVDCREITGTTVTINLETSPAKDENLFTPMTSFLLTTTSVTIAKFILAQNPTVPLARWVRWKLIAPAAIYDATFKVLVTCNPTAT